MKTNWLMLKKRYWEPRSAQERQLFKLLALGLLPVLVYVILWQPAHDAIQKLKLANPVLQMDVERLRDQANEVEMLRHRPSLYRWMQ